MPVTRRQLSQLARAIEERREALRAEIRSDVRRAREEQFQALAGGTPDSGDEAVADLIVDIDQAEVGRDLGELRALEAAQKRIGEGTFGVCIDCAADIPLERLKAELGAARCLACQQRHEKTYKT